MIFILIGVLILLITTTYLKLRNRMNPLIIFLTLWVLILSLYSLRLYDLYKVQIFTLFILLIGITLFTLGYLLAKSLRIRQKRVSENKINGLLIIIFSLVSLYLYFKDLRVIIDLNLDLYEVRQMISTIGSPIYSNRTRIDGILHILLVNPFTYAITIISAIEFWKNKNYCILLLSLLFVILHILTHGDRLIVFISITNFILAYYFMRDYKRKELDFLKQHKLNFKKQHKIYFLVLMVLAVTFFIFISNTRGSDPIRSIYVYISGVVPHLDARIEIINLQNHITYGFSSFAGFFNPLFQVLASLGVLAKPEIWNSAQIMSFVENPLYISNELQMNAFVSPFFYFYLDFRIMGVIFLSFGYGVIVSISHSVYLKYGGSKALFILLLLTQGLLFSMIRFEFANPSYALALFFVLIYNKRRF